MFGGKGVDTGEAVKVMARVTLMNVGGCLLASETTVPAVCLSYVVVEGIFAPGRLQEARINPNKMNIAEGFNIFIYPPRLSLDVISSLGVRLASGLPSAMDACADSFVGSPFVMITLSACSFIALPKVS